MMGQGGAEERMADPSPSPFSHPDHSGVRQGSTGLDGSHGSDSGGGVHVDGASPLDRSHVTKKGALASVQQQSSGAALQPNRQAGLDAWASVAGCVEAMLAEGGGRGRGRGSVHCSGSEPGGGEGSRGARAVRRDEWGAVEWSSHWGVLGDYLDSLAQVRQC